MKTKTVQKNSVELQKKELGQIWSTLKCKFPCSQIFSPGKICAYSIECWKMYTVLAKLEKDHPIENSLLRKNLIQSKLNRKYFKIYFC